MPHQLLDQTCEVCGKPIQANRVTRRTCSTACRSRLYRQRHARLSGDLLGVDGPERQMWHHLAAHREELAQLILEGYKRWGPAVATWALSILVAARGDGQQAQAAQDQANSRSVLRRLTDKINL